MQEKTERPTPRKLKKAKERGEIAQSSELATALIFLSGLLFLWGFSSLFGRRLKETFVAVYSTLNAPDLTPAFYRAFSPLLYPTLLILGALFLVAFFSHFFQTGWIWSWKKSKKRAKPRLIFPLLKLGVIASIAYFALRGEKPSMRLLLTSSSEKLIHIFNKVYFLLLEIAVALVVLGICDYFYQKWKYYQQMHMTPQELKEEKRETEGDQRTKSKMRDR